ncbi:MAG: DUF2796 domain-containing protein [Hyphomicrobiaceae bacterium]
MLIRSKVCLPVAALFALATTPAGAEEVRQLGAHVHGHGRLGIAIEGRTVSLELEAPGMDIVGFEHPATTDADKAIVEQAKATLADPSKLFAFPADAGCRTVSTEVELHAEEHHDDEDEAATGATAEAGEDHDDHDGHTEFHVTYNLDCAEPASIGTIELPFFAAFPGSQELDVTIVGDRGQAEIEVPRASPRLDLSAL